MTAGWCGGTGGAEMNAMSGSIIGVLIVAAGGLLWLVFKRRS